jgi:hypothetical protein
LRAVQYSQRNNVEGEQRRFLDSLASSLIHTRGRTQRELSSCIGGLGSSSLHTERTIKRVQRCYLGAASG